MPKDIVKLVSSIILCELAGIIGSFFTISAISNWYIYLNKPSFSPPNYLFGPVWTTLYFLMGVSLYLVWQKKKKVPSIFWVQLFLNAIWSILFFGLKSPILGLLDIIFLLIAIVLTVKSFYKSSKAAAFLLLPYLAWVTFATVLNFSIWILNK